MIDCWPALIPTAMLIGAGAALLRVIRRQTLRHRAQVERISAKTDETLAAVADAFDNQILMPILITEPMIQVMMGVTDRAPGAVWADLRRAAAGEGDGS